MTTITSRGCPIAILIVCSCANGCGGDQSKTVPSNPREQRNLKTAAGAVSSTKSAKTPVDSQTLLKRIVDAYGGKRLEGVNCCRIRYETKVTLPDIKKFSDVPKVVVTTDWFDGPTRMKRIALRKDTGAEVVVAIINGKKMWLKDSTGMFVERAAPAGAVKYPVIMSFPLELMKHQRLGSDFSLIRKSSTLQSEEFELTVKQNGESVRHAIVIDAKTKLLVSHRSRKSAISMLGTASPAMARTEVRVLRHRDFDGISLPTHLKVLQDNRVVFEVSVLEFETLKELPRELFENPES